MRGLVERLLELARADNGQVQTTFDDVQFSKLVFDAILPFEPIFFEKGLTLSSQLEEDIVLRGSQSHLKQVVEILLDNAQKYSDPQGEVLIKLRRQSRGRCLMSVSNPGPALSQEDLSNIFKRFYRMDKARSRDGGVGLGLAIAQSIVQAHHGRIWAESTNGINTFCVSLPTV